MGHKRFRRLLLERMSGLESTRDPSRALETAARFGWARQEPHRVRSPSKAWGTQYLSVCVQNIVLASAGDAHVSCGTEEKGRI